MSQAACDVGIGFREGVAGLVCASPDTGDGIATRSSRLASGRCRRRPPRDGIAVTIGSRYPAAHPNNLLQAFRGVSDPEDGAVNPLAPLCRRARIEAVQLELGIPLRWPGPRRETFLSLLVEGFGSSHRRPAAEDLPARTLLRAQSGRVTRRRGMQFIAGDLMLMTSIDVGAEGTLGGRLLVTTHAEELALFTGEVTDRMVTWAVPPLAIHDLGAGSMRIMYEGPLVGFPTLTPFLDLERGLAAATCSRVTST